MALANRGYELILVFASFEGHPENPVEAAAKEVIDFASRKRQPGYFSGQCC
jgi:hypothetical protein